MSRWQSALAAAALAAAVGACGTRPAGRATGPGGWTAEKVAVIEGLQVPECVCPDPDADAVYVSNIETSNEQYWAEDGEAFIALATKEGELKELRWVDSSPDAPLNSPKGLAVLGEWLYIADVSKLRRCPRSGTARPRRCHSPAP